MKSINNMINVHQLLLIYCVITSSYVWFHFFQNGNVNINKQSNYKIQKGRNLLQADETTHDNYDSEEIAIGSILIWGGSIDEIPDGFQLCNGEHNTPDLTDRFIIGAGNTYNIHETGGNFYVELTINELPSHTHKLQNDSIIIEETDDEHYHQIFAEDITISFDTGHSHQISTNNVSLSGEHSHSSNYNLSNAGDHIHKVVKLEKRYFNFNPTTTPTHNSSIAPTSNPSIAPTNLPNVEISASNTANPTTDINTADYSIDFELETLSISNGLSIDSVSNHVSSCSLSMNAAGNHQHVTINLGGVGVSDVQGQHAHSVGGTCNGGAHSHGISGNSDLELSDVYTTQKGAHLHAIEGKSSVDGMHSHELYAVSDRNDGHNHIVYGQTDYGSDNHTHEVIFGETEFVGDNQKINIVNPYYSLAYIIKTSNVRYSFENSAADTMLSKENDSVSNAAVVLSVLAVIAVIILCVVLVLMHKSYKNENAVNEFGEQHNIENEKKYKKVENIELEAINTCDIGEVIERIDDNVIDNIENNVENDGIDTGDIQNIINYLHN